MTSATNASSSSALWTSTEDDTQEISQHYPQLRDLSDLIVREGNYPINGGSYADVYMGRLPRNGTETKVAIKVIRPHLYSEDNRWKIDKRLRREINVWSRLMHPNVIPLLGIATNFGPYTAMVSPWMDEGDLYTYLRNSKVVLSFSRRLDILSEIAEGLYYLHSQLIIHGDLMPSNILMNHGKAHLADFGLSNVMADIRGPSFMTSKVGGSVRWAAPELFQIDVNYTSSPELTTHCDVYSFGSVALYVLSGQIPYENLLTEVLVLLETVKGNHPPRPLESPLTEDSWNFIKLCWDRNSSKRPDALKIKELLVNLQPSEIDLTYGNSKESGTERVHDAPSGPGPQLAESTNTAPLVGPSKRFLTKDMKNKPLIKASRSPPLSAARVEMKGILVCKHYMESWKSRARDKSWRELFVVIRKGELMMYMYDKSLYDPLNHVWTDEQLLRRINLAHSLAHVLPPPGYNRKRPHCMVLSLPNGGTYFFQADSGGILEDWVSACHSNAARVSCLLRANIIDKPFREYGWTFTTLPENSRDIYIATWRSPMPISFSGIHSGDDKELWTDLEKCTKFLKRELDIHHEYKEKLKLLFNGSNDAHALKAHKNWDARYDFLLREVVKYDIYKEAIQAFIPPSLIEELRSAVASNPNPQVARARPKPPVSGTLAAIHRKASWIRWDRFGSEVKYTKEFPDGR